MPNPWDSRPVPAGSSFTLLATDAGLARLAGVISAARADERWRTPLDDPE